MAPEDVVDVLSRMTSAVRHGGWLLDLQAIRLFPRVEGDGRALAEIDTTTFLHRVDAAVVSVDAAVAAGSLVETGRDEHEVVTHYLGGTELLADWAEYPIAAEAQARIRAIEGPLVVRERCRLRSFVVV